MSTADLKKGSANQDEVVFVMSSPELSDDALYKEIEDDKRERESKSKPRAKTTNERNDSRSSSGPDKREICSYFLNGTCKFGSSCMNRHTSRMPSRSMGRSSPRKRSRSPPPRNSMPKKRPLPHWFEFCMNFQKGRCPNEECRYIHAKPSDIQLYRSAGEVSQELIDQVMRNIGRLEAAILSTGATAVCRNFMKGNCTKGFNCNFRHLEYEDCLKEVTSSIKRELTKQWTPDTPFEFPPGDMGNQPGTNMGPPQQPLLQEPRKVIGCSQNAPKGSLLGEYPHANAMIENSANSMNDMGFPPKEKMGSSFPRGRVDEDMTHSQSKLNTLYEENIYLKKCLEKAQNIILSKNKSGLSSVDGDVAAQLEDLVLRNKYISEQGKKISWMIEDMETSNVTTLPNFPKEPWLNIKQATLNILDAVNGCGRYRSGMGASSEGGLKHQPFPPPNQASNSPSPIPNKVPEGQSAAMYQQYYNWLSSYQQHYGQN